MRRSAPWIPILLAVLLANVPGCGGSPDTNAPEPGPRVQYRPPPLRLASDIWPPFTDVSARPRVALDLAHAAFERADIDARTSVDQGFGDITRRIEAGEIDGSAALWRSREREKLLIFSRPYLENRVILVARKGKSVDVEDLSVLGGERIAVVKNYAYGDAIENALGPIFVEGASDQENFASLLRGEVDYLLADELLVQHLLDNEPDQTEERLEIGTRPLARRTLHLAIRRDFPGAQILVQRFDTEIRRMIADGSFNRVLRVHWIRVDADGDGRLELVGNPAGMRAPKRSYDLFLPVGPESRESDPGRFLIDGEEYERWDQVPARYKKPSLDAPPQPDD